MRYPSTVISAIVATAMIAAPLSSASAHGRGRGGLFFGLASAVIVGAAAIATAPLRVLAAVPYGVAPAYAPPPPPVYMAPPPAYTPPPQAYYAPAPAYYSPPPAYSAPAAYGAPPANSAPPAYGAPPAYSAPPGYAVPPGYKLVPQ